jgi:hypothetical protein
VTCPPAVRETTHSLIKKKEKMKPTSVDVVVVVVVVVCA